MGIRMLRIIGRCMVIALVSHVSSQAARLTLPADLAGNVNEFGAYGSDNLDDTRAIRDALAKYREADADYYGMPKILYFPAGTYLVSDTITWNGCAVTIQGQGTGATIIKLVDGAAGFNDPAHPRAVFVTPDGNMAFRQNFHDLTINTGSNNAGAIGLDYISSNCGTVRDVEILSGDGKGVVGLSMIRQWPGPLLIKNVSVTGFDYGIKVAHAEYGPTFENIALQNQRVAGILNDGNILALRKITSTNSVPAIQNPNGFVICLDSRFTGGATTAQAITSQGTLFLRNLSATGYRSILKQDSTVFNGLTIDEYCSDTAQWLFPSPRKSLNLPIAETPEFIETAASQWIKFTGENYGDNNIGPVLNSGKSTVYFQGWNYLSGDPKYVKVPPSVRRIIGFNCIVNNDRGETGYVFQVADNSPNPLIIERFGYGVIVEHSCSRTVVIRHGGIGYRALPGAGDLFIEDVVSDTMSFIRGQHVYMRQINVEGARTHLTNDGATLWILGVKTEGRGTVVKTINGGSTEVLGTLLYPVESSSSGNYPAFIATESSLSCMFRISAYAANAGYPILIEETRNGVTKKLTSTNGFYTMPLFTGYDGTAVFNARRAAVASKSLDGPAFRSISGLSGRSLTGQRQPYTLAGKKGPALAPPNGKGALPACLMWLVK